MWARSRKDDCPEDRSITWINNYISENLVCNVQDKSLFPLTSSINFHWGKNLPGCHSLAILDDGFIKMSTLY